MKRIIIAITFAFALSLLAFSLAPIRNYKNKTFGSNEDLVNWIKEGDVETYQGGRYSECIARFKNKGEVFLLKPCDLGELLFDKVSISANGEIIYYYHDDDTPEGLYDLFVKIELLNDEDMKLMKTGVMNFFQTKFPQYEKESSYISVSVNDEKQETLLVHYAKAESGEWYGLEKNGMCIKVCYCGNRSFDVDLLNRLLFEYVSLSTPADIRYNDVTQNDWHYEDVKYATFNEYIPATSETTFSPNIPADRVTIASALYNVRGNPIGYSSNFDDIKSDSLDDEAVGWAQSCGIVNGVGDNKFNPDGNVTRQDFAVMLLRYMKYRKFSLPENLTDKTFADDAEIAEYAKEAVYTLNTLGIMNGKGNNVIDPKGNVTRAEAAAMLHRMMDCFKK